MSTMPSFELADLRTRHSEGNKLYHEFLRVPALSTGLYDLPAGGIDPQNRIARMRSITSFPVGLALPAKVLKLPCRQGQPSTLPPVMRIGFTTSKRNSRFWCFCTSGGRLVVSADSHSTDLFCDNETGSTAWAYLLQSDSGRLDAVLKGNRCESENDVVPTVGRIACDSCPRWRS